MINNAQIGAIGECMTKTKLLSQGWDAFNANDTISNCSLYDIICVKDKDNIKLIQVKTTTKDGVLIGFSSEKAADIEYLKEKIVGPWVFIFVDKDNNYKYYILSREDTIKMIYETNKWYLSWDRKKPIKMSNVWYLDEKWFINKEYNDGKHQPLPQILTEDPKDNWDNIWK